MKNNNRTRLFIIGAIALVLLLGVSYAYFTANLQGGEETTTITVTGGTLTIRYASGDNINVSNIFPDDEPFAVKTFTVTGNNTTDLDMGYYLNLIVDSNSFSDDSINYTLSATNVNGNGTVADDIDSLVGITSEDTIYYLGSGLFEGNTNGDVVHSYVLELYFPNKITEQNTDQGANFKAHIEISGTSVTS